MDWECLTVSWLDCDMELSGRKDIHEASMQCMFKTRITTRRSFIERWLLGAELVHTSNIRDRARADHHIYTMAVTAYIAAVEASMHTHDTVKCIYTRPACHPCIYN